MKKKANIFIVLLAIWLIPLSLYAQFTKTKEITKRFKVNPETQIEITNKYGKIELHTWEKDSVVIKIIVKVEEKKLSKLEKSMDDVDFDFTESQHFLIARTAVDENKSALEREFLKFKETLLQTDGNTEINYDVWLPKSNKLKIENKFGDIYIDDYSGETEIDLSYGNLKSHDFSNRVEITLNFADATINDMKNGRLDCNYSEVYIIKAENLRVISKSSTFEILELKDLNAESRRDNFRIRLVNLVDAEGSFSDFRINEVTGRLTMRLEYGELDVETTSADFSNIFIESKSTDVNLLFSSGSNFGFDITHIKTDLRLGREMNVSEEDTIDEKENKIKLTGYFGKLKETDTKLFINASAGEINIDSD